MAVGSSSVSSRGSEMLSQFLSIISPLFQLHFFSFFKQQHCIRMISIVGTGCSVIRNIGCCFLIGYLFTGMLGICGNWYLPPPPPTCVHCCDM